jgi:hypothetical protein
MSEEQVADTAVEQEAAAEAPPSLGIQDLAAMVQVIDVCSKRGAFEGPELESVGVLRGRLVKFVEANKPPAPEGEAEGEAQVTPEAAPATEEEQGRMPKDVG